MPVAIITGASAGLGLALAGALAERGWTLIVDARGETALAAAKQRLGPDVIAIPGDVDDPAHRQALAQAALDAGQLDLLVNNASRLGPSPLPSLADHPPAALESVYRTNLFAPLGLIQLTLPLMRAARSGTGTIVNISSDAAVEPYPGWGGYGSAKAALDQLTAVLAAEEPALRIYGFDPGDMRTSMHQRAFPGEDISDRPEPESVVPALLRLIHDRPPSARYRAADLLLDTVVEAAGWPS